MGVTAAIRIWSQVRTPQCACTHAPDWQVASVAHAAPFTDSEHAPRPSHTSPLAQLVPRATFVATHVGCALQWPTAWQRAIADWLAYCRQGVSAGQASGPHAASSTGIESHRPVGPHTVHGCCEQLLSQQTPLVQIPDWQAAPLAHADPLAPSEQLPAPSQPIPPPQSVPRGASSMVHTACSRHCPSARHRPAGVASLYRRQEASAAHDGRAHLASSSGTASHRPAGPHAVHTPSHALSQQRPSTQCPDWQLVSILQVEPSPEGLEELPQDRPLASTSEPSNATTWRPSISPLLTWQSLVKRPPTGFFQADLLLFSRHLLLAEAT
jgi:hypothetical protein